MKCSVLNNKKWEKRFWINFSSVSVFHNEGGSKMSVEFSQLFDKVLFCIDESFLDEYGEEGIYRAICIDGDIGQVIEEYNGFSLS